MNNENLSSGAAVLPTSATKAETGKETRRRTPKNNQSDLYAKLKKARKQFSYQVTKDTKTKRECINQCFGNNHADELKYWMLLKAEAEKLVDSSRFKARCAELHLNPTFVAEHLVFEGKKTVISVRDEGLTNELIGYARMFHEPLYKDDFELYKDGKES